MEVEGVSKYLHILSMCGCVCMSHGRTCIHIYVHTYMHKHAFTYHTPSLIYFFKYMCTLKTVGILLEDGAMIG